MAWELAHGKSETEVRKIIEDRYGPIDAETMDELREIVRSGEDAGAYIQSLPLDQIPDINKIPLNTSLFGGENAGKRDQALIIWTDPVTGAKKYIRAFFPIEPTLAEILDLVRRRIDLISYYAPERFGPFSIDDINPATVSIPFFQRGW